MAQALVFPRFRAFDHSGNPLSGGKVYTYSAGTSSAKDSYPTAADALAGTNALSNPVILDANGESTIYLNGSYKIVLKDSNDVQQWSLDNVKHDMTPSEIDDYSSTDGVMQATVDPYSSPPTLNKPTNLAGELLRIRYMLAQITGETYWYLDADTDLATMAPYDVLTTRGDIMRRGASAPERVQLGNSGQVLYSDNTDVLWGVPPAFFGYAERSSFAYSDADTLLIDPGSYHHSGTSEQIVYWNSQITFNLGTSSGSNADNTVLGNDEWHYIYLDDSAIVTQGSPLLDADCFLNSTTVPTYSNAKHGWYNGDDRCIFAIRTNGSAQMLEFYHDGKDFIEYDAQIEISEGTLTPNSSWVTGTFIVPDFGDGQRVLCTFKIGTTATDLVYYRKKGSSNATGNLIGEIVNSTAQRTINTRSVTIDGSQQIEVTVSNATDTINAYANGWYLPRGM